MSLPPFDQWAPTEIVRLRERADALERALEMYLGKAPIPPGPRSAPRRSESPRAPRTSKYEPLFQAYERENRALSIQEMHDIAEREGFDIDRNILRSTVFAQRKIGRTRPEGDKYRWGNLSAPEQEPTPSSEEDVSDLIG